MVVSKQFPVVIVTGLSGAGKSTALKVIEDLGFFCVDGLPTSMVSRLINLFQEENPRNYRGLALGMDIRQGNFINEWEQVGLWLQERGFSIHLIFLEASAETLLKRYATTRRPHPLESQEIGLEQALSVERNLLDPLKQDADLVIDTTDFSIHDLRRKLQEKWSYLYDKRQALRIHILSFGYKYGVPKEADLLFDLRFLPNPYFDQTLRQHSGQEPAVAEYVLNNETGQGFVKHFFDFLYYILPRYAEEGRFRLTLALGCTGGRHRSVAMAELVYKNLSQRNYQVSLEHKHLELG